MDRMQQVTQEAANYYIGGASAGGRYNGVLKHPLYIDRADGSHFWDVDGKEYIDYHCGSGATMFGHNHPRIRKALDEAMSKGFYMNFDSPYHVELAKEIQKLFPSCERIRLSNTGSEATQAALRVARTFTGREKVVRFEGHFHGMYENIWFNHNGIYAMDEFGEVETTPDSSGFPKNCKDNVITIVYNNIQAVEHVVEKYRGQIAAMIMEPLFYNGGCCEPYKNYLEKVREICTRENIVLIFDEVICGLRMRPGSAQRYFNVIPDMTCMAKAIGGGLPISAFGGRADIMSVLNPTGPATVSGTYTGALLPVVASIECLKMAQEPGFYDHIEAIGDKLYNGITDLFKKHGKKGHCHGVGARFGIYFGIEDPETDHDFRAVDAQLDREMNRRFVIECLPRGLWFHDTAGKCNPAHYGISIAHTMEDVDVTLERLDDIFAII